MSRKKIQIIWSEIKILLVIGIPTVLASYLAVHYENPPIGLAVGIFSATFLMLILFWRELK